MHILKFYPLLTALSPRMCIYAVNKVCSNVPSNEDLSHVKFWDRWSHLVRVSSAPAIYTGSLVLRVNEHLCLLRKCTCIGSNNGV